MIAISNCILGSGVLRSFFFVFYIFFTMSFSDLAVAYGEYCSVLNDALTQAEDDIWATNCSYRTFCLCIIIDSRILRSPLDTSQIFNFSRKKNPPTVSTGVVQQLKIVGFPT